MEYYNNTLKFPEYGRNIQRMVDYVSSLSDPIDQEKSAKATIAVMINLCGLPKNNPETIHQLWDHLVIMSNYKLAKFSPYPIPDEDATKTKPNTMTNYFGEMKYPTFGRIVEQLIEKCKTIQDPDRRNNLIETITNHMKKSYLLWNKENIADEVIFMVLKEISEGQLEVTDEDLKLIDGIDFMKAKNKVQYNRNNQSRNNRNQNRRYYNNFSNNK